MGGHGVFRPGCPCWPLLDEEPGSHPPMMIYSGILFLSSLCYVGGGILGLPSDPTKGYSLLILSICSSGVYILERSSSVLICELYIIIT